MSLLHHDSSFNSIGDDVRFHADHQKIWGLITRICKKLNDLASKAKTHRAKCTIIVGYAHTHLVPALVCLLDLINDQYGEMSLPFITETNIKALHFQINQWTVELEKRFETYQHASWRTIFEEYLGKFASRSYFVKQKKQIDLFTQQLDSITKRIDMKKQGDHQQTNYSSMLDSNVSLVSLSAAAAAATATATSSSKVCIPNDSQVNDGASSSFMVSLLNADKKDTTLTLQRTMNAKTTLSTVVVNNSALQTIKEVIQTSKDQLKNIDLMCLKNQTDQRIQAIVQDPLISLGRKYFRLGMHYYESCKTVVAMEFFALAEQNHEEYGKFAHYYIKHLKNGQSEITKHMFKLFEQKCSCDQEPEPEALYLLGLCYEVGFGMIFPNQDEAERKYIRASVGGSTQATVALAQLYRKNIYREKENIMKSFNLMKKAADAGSADGCYHVANFYRFGYSGEQNLNQETANEIAIYYYMIGHALGHLYCAWCIADMCNSQNNVCYEIPDNCTTKFHVPPIAVATIAVAPPAAVAATTTVAAAAAAAVAATTTTTTTTTTATAAFAGAVATATAAAIDVRNRNPFYWYQRSAEVGNQYAQCIIGVFLFNQQNNDTYKKDGLHWCKLGVDYYYKRPRGFDVQENRNRMDMKYQHFIGEAAYIVASYHETGNVSPHIEKNKELALFLYSLSAEYGYSKSMLRLYELCEDEKMMPLRKSEALHYYSKYALENANTDAKHLYVVACHYMKGTYDGICDLQNAANFFRKCLEHGYEKRKADVYCDFGIMLLQQEKNEEGQNMLQKGADANSARAQVTLAKFFARKDDDGNYSEPSKVRDALNLYTKALQNPELEKDSEVYHIVIKDIEQIEKSMPKMPKLFFIDSTTRQNNNNRNNNNNNSSSSSSSSSGGGSGMVTQYTSKLLKRSFGSNNSHSENGQRPPPPRKNNKIVPVYENAMDLDQ